MRPITLLTTLLLVALPARGDDGALPVRASALAPGPTEWRAAVEVLEARVARAEVLATAALRLQNRWGALLATTPSPCAEPANQAVGARLVPFGEAWRDGVQAARVQLDRVGRLREEPTVAPLLDEDAAERVDALAARVAHQIRAYGEHRAWHLRHAPRLGSCGVPSPTAGLPSPQPWAVSAGPVAVLSLGGRVCTAAGPATDPTTGADGAPRVVVVEGPACWSASGCGCQLAPVEPGAVLGPVPGGEGAPRDEG